ncbi:MAG: hypothetical protein K2P58_04175 [Hyphomonadaceae bacterium]|nr:hypothetical protein [Hyphomonadaceae bacterium]
MRTVIRGLVTGLVAGVLLLGACQRQPGTSSDEPGVGGSGDRESALAAEQLAALGGPANPEQRALYEGEFQASGGVGAVDESAGGEGGGSGEGAWELRLYNDYAQFSRPGLGDDGGIPGERDYRERGMRVVAGAVIITLSHAPCTTSGLQLDYVARVIYEGVSYEGCARRGVAEGERPTWALALPDLVPAIDACLGRMAGARVTFASAIGGGQTSVRLRARDGARVECVADGAGEIAVFEPLADSDRRTGEGDPEFQRGGVAPAAQACWSSEEAIDRDGQPIGWLFRRTC